MRALRARLLHEQLSRFGGHAWHAHLEHLALHLVRVRVRVRVQIRVQVRVRVRVRVRLGSA